MKLLYKKRRILCQCIALCVCFLGLTVNVYATEHKTETETEKKRIVEILDYDVYSGDPYKEYCISEDELDTIESALPNTIPVKLAGQESSFDLPVTWEVDGDTDKIQLGLNVLKIHIDTDKYEWAESLYEENADNVIGVEPFLVVTVEQEQPVDEMSYDASSIPNARVFYSARTLGVNMQFGAGANGGMVGSVGKGYGIEGIFMRIDGNSNLGIQYRTYSPANGWTAWQTSGNYSGATASWNSNSYITYIQFQLTGSQASEYSLSARLHVASTGWLPIVTAAGSTLTTVGNGNQIQAMEFELKVNNTVQKTGYHLTSCSGCKSYVCQRPNLYLYGEGTYVKLAEFVHQSFCAPCNYAYPLYLHVDHYYISCCHSSEWADTSGNTMGEYRRTGTRLFNNYCTNNGGSAPDVSIGDQTVNSLYGHQITYCTLHNTANTYTVNYNGNGATGGSTASSAHTYDSAKALTANGFYKTGYTFIGWSTSQNGSVVYSNGQSVANLTTSNGGNVTLYAVWQRNTYTNTIAHWAGGFKNGEGNNSSGDMYKINATSFQALYASAFTLCPNNAVTIPNGYALSNYFGTTVTASWSGQTMPYTTSQPAYAFGSEYYYQPETYTITYKMNKGTNHSGNPSSYNVLYGVALQDPTRKNYRFTGWTATTEGKTISPSVTSNNWNQLAILKDIQPGTSYDVHMDSAVISSGSATQFTTLIYDFTTGTVLDQKELSFGSDISYTVTCPDSADASHDIEILAYAGVTGSTAGNIVTFNNVTTTYETTGINAGDNACFASNGSDIYSALSPRMTGNITLEANWELIHYTIHYHGNGNTGGETPDSEHDVGVTKPLASNQFTKDGYAFTEWNTKANGTGTSYKDGEEVLDIVTEDNLDLYAQWEIAIRNPNVVCKVKKSDIWEAHGDSIFIFKLEGSDVEGNPHTYYTTVMINADLASEDGTYVTVIGSFKGVLAGTYTISQEEVGRWEQIGISKKENCTITGTTAVYDLIHYENASALFENAKYEWQGYSDATL